MKKNFKIQIHGFFLDQFMPFFRMFILWSLFLIIPALNLPCLAAEPVQSIIVREFRFEGNTAVPETGLMELALPYRDRPVTFAELNQLRNILTRHYISKGYINSGVIIPDQKVSSGIVVFRVIEGSVTDIKIEGNEWLRTGYIKNRLERETETPFDVNRLQDGILMLQDSDLIEKINAEIVPGMNPGEASLDVKIQEKRPYHAGFRFSNSRSPSVGAEILEIYASHLDLAGFGDRLEAGYGFTEGVDDFSVNYEIPVNSSDTVIGGGYSKGTANVVEEPFASIDVENRQETFRVKIAHPFIKKRGTGFWLGLLGEKKHSESYLLGSPFSFSEGVENGESDVTALRFFQNWESVKTGSVISLLSTFSKGINALDATDRPVHPDGEFFSWQARGYAAARFQDFHDIQAVFRTSAQVAACALLPVEKFVAGGASTVRGFRENRLLADSGAVFSLEARIPVVKIPVSALVPDDSVEPDGTVHFCVFTDYGYVRNFKNLPENSQEEDQSCIWSAGAGLRLSVSERTSSHIYWGHALKEPDSDTDGRNLQDYGVHFLVQWGI